MKQPDKSQTTERQAQGTKYVSFKTDSDAHLFQVNVEHYNEIDWLDYDMRTRQTIHRLLEPCMKA